MDDWVSGVLAHFGHEHCRITTNFLWLSGLSLFKTIPFVAVLCGLWVSSGDRAFVRRAVISGFVGTLIALVVSRLIQDFSPHHPRPFASGHFDFVSATSELADWSSFPSDTTALASAMALAIYLASRRLGAIALIYAIVGVALSKLLGGAHYLSDVVAGYLIGLCSTWCVWNMLPVIERHVHPGAYVARHAVLFYSIAFTVAFQYANMFDDIRQIAGTELKALGVVKDEAVAPTRFESPPLVALNRPH